MATPLIRKKLDISIRLNDGFESKPYGFFKTTKKSGTTIYFGWLWLRVNINIIPIRTDYTRGCGGED